MKRHTIIAVIIGVAVVVLLLATATQGFVRDEGYYFRAAREYHAWFEQLAHVPIAAFSDASLKQAFGYNTEHPGFVKILMGWTWKISHVWLGAASGATGFRLGAILLVAAGASFTYLFAARLAGRWPVVVGCLAVALLLSAPHVFYHAHLACFDGPIMGLSVAASYGFWRACEERRWVIPAAILWGLALATKHNAVFLFAGFVLAVSIVRFNDVRVSDMRIRLPALPIVLLVTPLIGAVVLYVFYPYGWHNPFQRIGAYYAYHARHEHYPVDFFGTMYTAPPFPWGYAFRMTALTVPITTLVTGVLGLVALAGRAWSGTQMRLGIVVLLMGALVPPLVISFPTVPIFGGTKHWMPMMPFLAIAAAYVAVEAIAAVRYRVAQAAVLALLVVIPTIETVRTHPYGHTYFNEAIFGHQGGAALSLPRTFWGGDARPLFEVLNRKARIGARVYTHRMNQAAWVQYQSDGIARRDLVLVGDIQSADWIFINHQREYQDAEYTVWERNQRPEAIVEFDGVPIVSLYRAVAR